MPTLHKLLQVKVEPGLPGLTDPVPTLRPNLKARNLPDVSQKGDTNSDSAAVPTPAAETTIVTTKCTPSNSNDASTAPTSVLTPIKPSVPSPAATSVTPEKQKQPATQAEDAQADDDTGNDSEDIVEPNDENEAEEEKPPNKRGRKKSTPTKTTPPNKKQKASPGDSAGKKPRTPRISEMKQLQIANKNVHYGRK